MNKRFTYFLLSLGLALSLSLTLFNFTAIITLKNTDLVAARLGEYRSVIKEDIINEFNERDFVSDIPDEVVFAAVDAELENIIAESANNFIVSNPNDFSGYDELYNSMFRSCEEYSKENALNADSKEISKLCSLAVDCVNTCLSKADTQNTKLFKYAQSTAIFIISVVLAVFAVFCVLMLDFLNKGRHRKNSYIGMGLTTAGYIEAVIPVIVCRLGFVEKEDFCGYAPFNQGLYSAVLGIMQLQVIFGLVLVVAGVIMLAVNYRYFAKKNSKARRENEIHESMKSKYNEEYNNLNPQKENAHGEREVIDVDF
ncbi:MAG: hypothetical protein IJS03_04195 [Eubacterium sp.]|nr:hypothetical protein [Eubacterium sp.]